MLLLLLLAGLMFGSALGLRDPWPADEPRFALVAKEMVETGEWLFPRRGGELYPDKPPLFMWAQASLYALTGSLRIAFVLPSMLASLVSLLLVYDLGRRLWNRRAGFAAASALLFTLQFTLQAKAGQIDALLAMWVTLGLYGFVRHLLLGPSWGWYWSGWAAAGFGVVTKGVGILAPFALIPYLYARRRGWRGLAAIPRAPGKWWLGPLVMLGVIALWLVPMLLAVMSSNDPALQAYRDNILFRQTAERYASPEHHFQPIWYFFVEVIPWAWLPLSAALPWLVPAWWRRLKRGDTRHLLLLGWVALVLLFFTLSPGKRGVYILPALSGLALAAGPVLPGLLGKINLQRTLFGVLVAFGAVSIVTGLATLFIPALADPLQRSYGDAPTVILLVVGTVALAWALLARPRRGALAYAGFAFTLWAVLGWWIYPALDPARSSAQLMTEVGRAIGPRAELALVNWKEQTLLQADRPTTNFGFLRDVRAQERDAAAWLRQGDDRWVLLQDSNLAPCFDAGRARYMGRWHRRDWYLVDRSALSGRCEDEAPLRARRSAAGLSRQERD
jgi:4-amino-4-deoxy-L-arabinose transferase-like glycosyltransferase